MSNVPTVSVLKGSSCADRLRLNYHSSNWKWKIIFLAWISGSQSFWSQNFFRFLFFFAMPGWRQTQSLTWAKSVNYQQVTLPTLFTISFPPSWRDGWIFLSVSAFKLGQHHTYRSRTPYCKVMREWERNCQLMPLCIHENPFVLFDWKDFMDSPKANLNDCQSRTVRMSIF